MIHKKYSTHRPTICTSATHVVRLSTSISHTCSLWPSQQHQVLHLRLYYLYLHLSFLLLIFFKKFKYSDVDTKQTGAKHQHLKCNCKNTGCTQWPCSEMSLMKSTRRCRKKTLSLITEQNATDLFHQSNWSTSFKPEWGYADLGKKIYTLWKKILFRVLEQDKVFDQLNLGGWNVGGVIHNRNWPPHGTTYLLQKHSSPCSYAAGGKITFVNFIQQYNTHKRLEWNSKKWQRTYSQQKRPAITVSGVRHIRLWAVKNNWPTL